MYWYLSLMLPVIYLFLLLAFQKAWLKYDQIGKRNTTEQIPSVSVVIAFRNEALNLPGLLKSIGLQDYPLAKYELILVNDHSTDSWQGKLVLPQNARILGLPNSEYGKKAAIAFGIAHSTAQYIVQTDADCRFQPQWITTIVATLVTNNATMVVAPVRLNGGFLSQIQQLEFSALQALTAGTVAIGKPIMCNAANLAFSRKAYLQHKQISKPKYATGDDIFLLHKLKKTGKIAYAKSPFAVVQTEASETAAAFFSQRIRWASKAGAYTDWFTNFVGSIVFLVNLQLLLLFAYSFVNHLFVWLFGTAFIIKFLADYLLTNSYALYFNERKLVKYYFKLSVIYPMYSLTVAVFSQLVSVYWKERKLRRGK